MVILDPERRRLRCFKDATFTEGGIGIEWGDPATRIKLEDTAHVLIKYVYTRGRRELLCTETRENGGMKVSVEVELSNRDKDHG